MTKMLNPLRDKNQVVNMEACLYRGAEEKTPVITACPERAERERERESWKEKVMALK